MWSMRNQWCNRALVTFRKRRRMCETPLSVLGGPLAESGRNPADLRMESTLRGIGSFGFRVHGAFEKMAVFEKPQKRVGRPGARRWGCSVTEDAYLSRRVGFPRPSKVRLTALNPLILPDLDPVALNLVGFDRECCLETTIMAASSPSPDLASNAITSSQRRLWTRRHVDFPDWSHKMETTIILSRICPTEMVDSFDLVRIRL
jgi:hypothetical protein